MKKIGVQKELSNVADFLSNQGYSVQILNESMNNSNQNIDTFDAIITAGYNENIMGCCDTSTKVPMINASGLTPQDVKALLDKETNI